MFRRNRDSFIDRLKTAGSLRHAVVSVHLIRGNRHWSHGSGFFWTGSKDSQTDRRHLVVTNYHVISDKTPRSNLPKELQDTTVEYQVEVTRNRRLPARLLISDRLVDLAILEVEPSAVEEEPGQLPRGLRSRASHDEARKTRLLSYATPGEPVIRIGSPGVSGESDPEGRIDGQRHSNDRLRNLVTSGIVGGREFPNRQQEYGKGTELLITDAAGFRGNSGGPIIAVDDLNVVGVTSHGRYEPLGTGTPLEGVGFEAPAYWIDCLWFEYKRRQLEEGRTYLRRMSLGFEDETISFVRVQLPTAISREHEGQETAVQLVSFPKPGSPALLAKMTEGDILVSFDGIPIEDASCLIAALTYFEDDRNATQRDLVVYRNGERRELSITPVEYIPRPFTRKKL